MDKIMEDGEKPRPPWEVFFESMTASQQRKDGRVEMTMGNVEYIVFLAQTPLKKKPQEDTLLQRRANRNAYVIGQSPPFPRLS